ncbi:hypothetical protein EJ04DRAFT_133495 [Polyplosphaeria fusca]|uniref:C2H2-type domain-containing protein n=1 Tax=Polyplosphaeria fusca TaxID=682080 RepID=A0A9P4QMQ1_9PLEO|nr:hypothetical protein EJ04DRAFT_133495 [Polyplosphaeria fusca]
MDNPRNREPRNQSECLLGCGSFRGRSELTKHYQRTHVKTGTFDRPFPCPECLRQNMSEMLIEGGPSAWSNHVQAVHGKVHAPNLPSVANPVKGSSRCLLCERFFLEGGGLWRHVRRTHDQKEGSFKQPFPCPECYCQGKGDITINGFADWKDHVLSTHEDTGGFHPPTSRSFSPNAWLDDIHQQGSSGKRKRVGSVIHDLKAIADPAVDAAGCDWSDVTMVTSDTTCTTPGTATNSISGTQTPVSSVDSEILERIDLRLLSDYSRQGWKRFKSIPLDTLEVSDHDHRLSTQATDSRPVDFAKEGAELEDLKINCIPSTDP